MTDFGRTLEAKRRAAGLTQTQLGKRVGITQNRFSQLENNYRVPKKPDLFLRIAEAIGCPADDLCVAAGVLPPDMAKDLDKVVEMWRSAS